MKTGSRWLLLMIICGAFCAAGCGDPVEKGIRKLRSTDSYERMKAAEALGELKDSRAVDALIACLKDEDRVVRGCAVEALGAIGDKRALDPLMACLTQEFLEDASQHGHSLMRLYVIEAIGKLGPPAVEPLIARLKAPDESVRNAAAEALGLLGDRRAVEPLIASLKDQATTTAAATALGKLGDGRAVEPLLALLKEREPGVRLRAAESLGNLRDPRAFDPLIEWLGDKECALREGAAKALGDLGDARAVVPLIARLGDNEPVVRHAAAEAMGKLGDARAVAALVAALPEWESNKAYGAALAKLNWQPATEREQVYGWICSRSDKAMSNWETTRRVLLADVRTGNRKQVENAVYTFVALGREDIVPELISALDSGGDRMLAQTYLNCGHQKLAEAGRDWAYQRGYKIEEGRGGGMAVWGRW